MFSIDQQSHSSNIYAVKSSETEIIDLKNQVSTKLSVEKWLTQLEKEIKVSLRHTLRKTIKIANAEVHDFNPIDFYRAALLSFSNIAHFIFRTSRKRWKS